MTFSELVQQRYSSRSYLEKPVEKEKLLHIIETVRMAPSARNQQPWHFIVIDNETLLKKVCSTYQRPWINSAPVIIVACTDHRHAWRRADGKSSADTDISIAITHLILAATEAGLATCWVAKFNAMQCAEMLQLPEGIEASALIPIGYPADHPDTERFSKARKPLEEILSWNQYQPL